MPKEKIARSIRTTPILWDAAKARAEQDGQTISSVMNELLEGYALKKIHLPKVIKEYQ